MKTLIGCLTMLLAICGCKTDEAFTPETNATGMLTMEAMVFGSILMEKGAIPEITTDRHGNFQSGMMRDPKSEPEFPFNVQFCATMNDAPGTTYRFVITKIEQSSPWEMTKAWKQSTGVTMDLALPSADVQSAANAELQRRKTEEGTANKPAHPSSQGSQGGR